MRQYEFIKFDDDDYYDDHRIPRIFIRRFFISNTNIIILAINMSKSNFTTLLIFFLSYHLVWTKLSSSSSSCKNGNVCINGDCIDNDETTNDSHCKCRPCWRGSHCDQFGERNLRYFPFFFNNSSRIAVYFFLNIFKK